MPQVAYPEFTIFSKNLVPAYKCNSKRQNQYIGPNNSRILHPYYDDILGKRLLIMKLEAPYEIPIIDIEINLSEDDPMRNSVEFHFDKVVVVGKKLNRKFCNLTAHQILWMMSRVAEKPTEFEHNDHIDELIQKSCKHGINQTMKLKQFTETRNCQWGEFIVKYFYDPELETVAINLQQMQPYACHIAIKLSQENISPTRLMITWLMLKGEVRKEIAKLLLIAEDTVAEHIQAIFKHFNVKSTVEFVLKLKK